MGHGMPALRHGLWAATLAPSAHNSQPWRFRVDGESVELGWDAERRLPEGDPSGGYLAVGLGAAAESFALGLAEHGLAAETTIDWRPETLQAARIRSSAGQVDRADVALATQVARRKTTRLPFTAQPVSHAALASLATEAERGGCTLAVVQEPRRLRVIADAIGEGTASNFANTLVFDEFCDWLRMPDDGRRDGLALDALEMRGLRAALARHVLRPRSMRVLRRVGLHRLLAQDQVRLARATSTFCILVAPSPAPEDMFQAGRVVQRIWLRATMLDLRVHPMTAAIDHTGPREVLAAAFGVPSDAAIALCFRLGHGPAGVRSPRLPLQHLVDRSR